MTRPTLAGLLAEAAGPLEGIAIVAVASGTEYRLDDVLIATVSGDMAEFRLRDLVGAAALRTPDVTASSRGPGWVRFAPRGLDGQARDRATAWLESAWRRADDELAGVPEPSADDIDDDDDPDDETIGGGATGALD